MKRNAFEGSVDLVLIAVTPGVLRLAFERMIPRSFPVPGLGQLASAVVDKHVFRGAAPLLAVRRR